MAVALSNGREPALIIVLIGFRPDPIGGRDLEPNAPYTRQHGLDVVKDWPDIAQGETFVAWPSLFRQLYSFTVGSLN